VYSVWICWILGGLDCGYFIFGVLS
jgi:hypothetical protein